MPTKPALGVMFRREQHPNELAAAARKAEELGFDQFWIVEDCFYLGGISQATLALAATSTIKVGIGINPGVAHNAAILAMEYATLARAFPGRLIGGIGHGVTSWMQQIGEDVASPLTAIEETTTAMRGLLRGERLTVAGRYVTLNDVELDAAPEEAPPILLGVRGPKSVTLAGECADGVLLAENSAPAFVRQTRERMDAARTEPGYLGVYIYTLIDEQPERVVPTMRAAVAEVNANGLTAETRNLPFADDLAAMASEGGEDHLARAMPDDWVRELSIVGDIAEGENRIAAYAEAGADSVIFIPKSGWEWWSWLESIAPLARQAR